MTTTRLTIKSAWYRQDPLDGMSESDKKEHYKGKRARRRAPVTGAVPFGLEIEVLLEHYYMRFLDDEWESWLGIGIGWAEQKERYEEYDRRRALERLIDENDVEDVFESAVKQYSKHVPPAIWKAFVHQEEAPEEAEYGNTRFIQISVADLMPPESLKAETTEPSS
ncbi:MAG: hypothetical protein ABL961_11705 [Vicinamibacterales bacterium]